MLEDFDLLDTRRVDHEGPLDPDAAGDTADRDLPVGAAVTHPKDRSFEVLKALAVPFDDPDAHAHGVARPDLR